MSTDAHTMRTRYDTRCIHPMYTFISFISAPDAYMPSSIESVQRISIVTHTHTQIHQEEEQDFSIAPNLSAAEFVDRSAEFVDRSLAIK